MNPNAKMAEGNVQMFGPGALFRAQRTPAQTLLLQMVDGDDHTFSTGSFVRMEEDREEL